MPAPEMRTFGLDMFYIHRGSGAGQEYSLAEGTATGLQEKVEHTMALVTDIFTFVVKDNVASKVRLRVRRHPVSRYFYRFAQELGRAIASDWLDLRVQVNIGREASELIAG